MMNGLDSIRDFANPQTTESALANVNAAQQGAPLLAPLELLMQDSEWLQDQSLIARVLSRLENHEPQNREERAKAAAVYQKIFNLRVPLHLPLPGTAQFQKNGNDLQRVLKEAKALNIDVSWHAKGGAHIKMNDGTRAEQWDCLIELQDFFPITHLELTDQRNLDYLLAFAALTPQISDLNLGKSFDIDDEYIEKLSRHLLSIRSFSISSSPIKNIPRNILDNATTINCNCCHSLSTLKAPNATSIECCYCTNLTSINAPNATTLVCKGCCRLAAINAPNVESLDCSYCRKLPTIDAPKAATIDCNGCNALTSIAAPKVVTLDCSQCESMVTIESNAEILSCSCSPNLTQVEAPLARTIDSTACCKLSSVVAPSAERLDCHGCVSLKRVNAPAARSLNVNDCRVLTSVLAPKATGLFCKGCHSLSNIVAPNIARVNFSDCTALTSSVKARLFETVHKNIYQTHNANIDELFDRLEDLFSRARSDYQLSDPKPSPLKPWFIIARRLAIPAEFSPMEEQAKCELELDTLCQKLFSLAAPGGPFQGCELSWFNNLKKIHSHQKQMNRLCWLAGLLASSIGGNTPLADPHAHPILSAIGNLAAPLLRDGATQALTELYETARPRQLDIWKALQNHRPTHLLLPCLFFAYAKINRDLAERLLTDLDVRTYRDYRQLHPILEIAYMLGRDAGLRSAEREKILTIVLRAPPKEDRENAKLYAERLKSHRIEQRHWVTACRNLLCFGKGRELRNVQEAQSLLDKHKRACQTIFGVKGPFALLFMERFKSERHPNGLFTYAARLQTLPGDEKRIVTDTLGKFINGYLEGAFPNNRYDLAANVHLQQVFGENEDLLDKWRKPFEVDLTVLEEASQNRGDLGYNTGCDTVRERMKKAIDNRHLGPNQQDSFATLAKILEVNYSEQLQASLETLQEILTVLTLEDRPDQKQNAEALEIEIYCLKAIDPTADLSTRMETLRGLIDKIPAGWEFTNDVRGMLNAIDPFKQSKVKWIKLQTTDAWEDLFLMGTEVCNSCQRIDGDPVYNKCLLAYIVDGKNKLLIVRDSEGKIAARSVLRILWDKQKSSPVLFMEQIYTRKANPMLSELLIDGCIDIATDLGLSLVASAGCYPNGSPYPGQLDALGGPAPYEYVDALHKICKDGVFTITNSNVIYKEG